MDIDPEKEIMDLSQRLAVKAESKKSKKLSVGSIQKAIVELNKEDYLIISFKEDRKQLGIVNF